MIHIPVIVLKDDANRGHGEAISAAAATSKSGVRSSSYHGGHNAYSHATHSSGEDEDDDDVYADDSYHHQQHNRHQQHLQAYHPNYHQDEHMMARQRHESAYSNSSVGTTSRYDAITTDFVNPAAAAGAAAGGNPYDRSDSMTPTGSSSASMVKKARGELTCVVCGAAANGYNFDAITCESCKAFFRRNAFRPLVSFTTIILLPSRNSLYNFQYYYYY